MKNVVSFFGADNKCGTGMISQCVAERIASVAPNLNILLVHTNGRNSLDYSPTAGESMDKLRPYMADKLLDIDEIFEKSRWKDNLHIIGGTSELGSSFMYTPDMTGYLLECLCKQYDLIICDSGADIEHGLTIGSLIASDFIFLVMTQSETVLRHYEWQQALFEKLNLNVNSFVINKYDKNSPYNSKYVKDRLMLDNDKLFTIRLSEYGVRAEYDERSLVNYPGSSFRKDIDAVAIRVLESTGLRMTAPR